MASYNKNVWKQNSDKKSKMHKISRVQVDTVDYNSRHVVWEKEGERNNKILYKTKAKHN